jgi:hypothetical protein
MTLEPIGQEFQFIQSGTPTSGQSGDWWLDTSSNPPVAKVYDGSSWVATQTVDRVGTNLDAKVSQAGATQSDILNAITSDGQKFSGQRINQIYEAIETRITTTFNTVTELEQWSNTPTGTSVSNMSVSVTSSSGQTNRTFSGPFDLTGVNSIPYNVTQESGSDGSSSSSFEVTESQDESTSVKSTGTGSGSFDVSNLTGNYYLMATAYANNNTGENVTTTTNVTDINLSESRIGVSSNGLFEYQYGLPNASAFSPDIVAEGSLETVTYTESEPGESSVNVSLTDTNKNVLLSNISSGEDVSSVTTSPVKLKIEFSRTDTSTNPTLGGITLSRLN